jgi:hypothetical protein
MLVLQDKYHYERVVRFAHNTGQLHWLTARLWYLHTYAERTAQTPDKAPHEIDASGLPRCWFEHARGLQNVVTLFSDFAPASFTFEMVRPSALDRCWQNGGVIYRGSQTGWHAGHDKYIDPLCTLVGQTDNPWSVHT